MDERLKEIDRAIGARIRQRRQEWRIALSGLAKALGVSAQQMSNYERGVCSMPASRLVLAAWEMQVPVEWVTRDTGGSLRV